MRHRFWTFVVLACGLLLVLQLARPVKPHAPRYVDHLGPFVEVPAAEGGIPGLKALATVAHAPWKFRMPGTTQRRITLPTPADLHTTPALLIPFKLNGDSNGRVLITVQLVNRSGWIYERFEEFSVEQGKPRTLRLDLSAASAEMVALGHSRPWDRESARGIDLINLRVKSFRCFDGELEVGEPALEEQPLVAATWPPAEIKATNVAADFNEGLVTVGLRLDPPAPDPFDPERCDVRVLLMSSHEYNAIRYGNRQLPPAVVAQARPAYYDQEFLYNEHAPTMAEELKPLGLPRYVARIPTLKGVPVTSDHVAVLLLNGRMLGKTSVATGPAPQSQYGPVASGGTTLKQIPDWMKAGGEVFSAVYRPRTEWTGMHWPYEAARYQPKSKKEPARWNYEMVTPLQGCWIAPIEWNGTWGKWRGLGHYDLELCWRFDRVLDRACREGIGMPLLLVSDDMFFNQGKFRWPMNPLSKESGGPLSGPGRYFQETAGRDYLKRRVRYMAARYGTYPALTGWLFGATLPAEGVPEWHQEMAESLTALNNACGWFDGKGVSSVKIQDLKVEGVPSGPEAATAGGVNASMFGPPRPIISLHPWATKFSQVTRRNSFESSSRDEDYWKAEQRLSPGTKLTIVDSQASDGKRSAQLTGKFPGQVCLMRELLFATNEADNFYDYHSMVLDVFVPAGSPHDMRAVVHFRDRDELWYETLLIPLLRPGEWTRLVVDVTHKNSHGLKPVNHQRPWDDYSRTRLREIGVRVFCNRAYTGPVFIDNLHFAGKQVGRIEPVVKPAVTLREKPAAEVGRFDLWEANFDIGKSYPNPYDPEVVDVSARITMPSGKEVVVPAFFYEAYQRSLVKTEIEDTILKTVPRFEETRVRTVDLEKIMPVAGGMAGFWKLRYAPLEQGEHTVVLEVRETSKWSIGEIDWINDDRFSPDGKPYPGNRRWHGDFTHIPQRNSAGRRKMPRLTYAEGDVVARGEPIKFNAGPKVSPGYVKRSSDPKYFEHSDGTFHYPIGINLATPSEEQIPYRGGWFDQPTFADGFFKLRSVGHRGTYQYDDYFAACQKAGINWAKIWMATWWTSLEWRRDWPPYQGVGRYSQPNAWRMDHLVEEARRRGIYLQIILMNHGQVSSGINHDWENSPYNDELGGPVPSAREFYSDGNARKFFKNKLRYIAARWGYSTSIFDWTLCGEMDFTEDYQTNSFDLRVPSNDKPAPKAMLMWLEDMGAYMREIDLGRHLITTHVSHPQRGQNLQKATTLDYVQSNAYSGFPWLANNSMNAVLALNAFYYGQGGVHHFDGMQQFNKPVLVCEQGGWWHGVSPKYGNYTHNTRGSLDADLHCGLWAGMMTPLGGQTGYWWWLHVHFVGGYEHFTGAIKFMQGEDLRAANFERSEPEISGHGELSGATFKNATRGLAWLYHSQLPFRLLDEEITGVEVRISGMENGTYDVEYWHTVKGVILKRETVQTPALGTTLVLRPPTFNADVGIKFKKR